MTEQTAPTTGSTTASDKPDKAPPAPKPPKEGKARDAEDDWQDATKVNANGQQVGEDELPTAKVARAMALAEAGKATDKAGIVTDEEIAAYDPKAAEIDREAIAQHQQDKLDAARKAAEAEAEAQQKGE